MQSLSRCRIVGRHCVSHSTKNGLDDIPKRVTSNRSPSNGHSARVRDDSVLQRDRLILVPAASEVLRKVGLFASLSDGEVERLADSLKESTFSAGSVILTEGRGALAFFVIGSGTVEYSISGESVGSGSAGDYFGEVALIEDRPRAATVTAVTDVTVYGMTFWEFRALVEEHPDIAAELRRVMADRQSRES